MIFFTQITMEAAEDTAFLDAMRKARIKGALVGVEAVTAEGLKSVFKDFNLAGENLVERLQIFKEHGVHVLGSFIFGLSTDRADTFEATADSGQEGRADVRAVRHDDAVSGHRGFRALGEGRRAKARRSTAYPLTRYWLIPGHLRPKLYTPHPTMSPDEIRAPHAEGLGRLSTAFRRSGNARIA